MFYQFSRRARIWSAALSLVVIAPLGGRAPQSAGAARQQHAECTVELSLAAAPDKVFPLFGPIEETYWSPGWHPAMIHPPTDSPLVAGAVFTEHGDTWVLTVYDPAIHALHYVFVSRGRTVGELDIRLQDAGHDATHATIVHRLTALSSEGDDDVRGLGAHFPLVGKHWERAINLYLAGKSSPGSKP